MSHFDEFRDMVSSKTDVISHIRKLRKKPGDIGKDAIKGRFSHDPVIQKYDCNMVVCDAPFAYMNEDWDKTVNAVIFEDTHRRMKRIIPRYKGFKHIFSRYGTVGTALPHSVNTFTNNKKTGDVLITGSGGEGGVYPHRLGVANKFKGKDYFTRIIRPLDYSGNKYPCDNDYLDIVSSYKIHPTCGSKFNYAVRKFVEIPSCNTLLMSNMFDGAKYLGFEDGKNMVVYQDDVVKQVEWWLAHDDDREEIALKGQELIKERHTTDRRADEFLEMILA